MKYYIRQHTLYFLSSFIMFFLLTTAEIPAQRNDQPSEAFAEMKELVSSGNFVFEADRMLPQSGGSKYLTTTYTLSVKDTTAKAHLPYYGVAYSNVDYGGDISVSFDGPVQNYSQEEQEGKERILIKFKIRGDNAQYQCSLSVSKSGSATLHVIPDNRQSISYWGDVKAGTN